MRPTFSLITANHNSGDKLRRTFHSIKNQDVDLEYIIVDGVSSDGSLDVALEIAASDSRVKVISEKDKGIYDAMNKGISAASGRCIYFLGAGDELISGALAALLKHLPDEQPTMLYGNVLINDVRYDGQFDWRKLVGKNICQQGIVYTSNLFRLLGLFTLDYPRHADWEFNLRCFGNRNVVKHYVPVDIAYFEPNGVSYSGDVAFERDKMIVLRRTLGWLPYLIVRSRGWRPRLRSPFGQPFLH